jgi:hypothetical protein
MMTCSNALVGRRWGAKAFVLCVNWAGLRATAFIEYSTFSIQRIPTNRFERQLRILMTQFVGKAHIPFLIYDK